MDAARGASDCGWYLVDSLPTAEDGPTPLPFRKEGGLLIAEERLGAHDRRDIRPRQAPAGRLAQSVEWSRRT